MRCSVELGIDYIKTHIKLRSTGLGLRTPAAGGSLSLLLNTV